jgi:fluoride exporter
MNRYIVVTLGAAAGGLARYVVGNLVMQRFPARFPLGILVVNVTGCFFIGLLMTWFTERGEPHPAARLLLVTGVLGGYTTFSAFGWESFAAIEGREYWIGLGNIAASVVAGYLAVWCGAWLARR